MAMVNRSWRLPAVSCYRYTSSGPRRPADVCVSVVRRSARDGLVRRDRRGAVAPRPVRDLLDAADPADPFDAALLSDRQGKGRAGGGAGGGAVWGFGPG